MADKVEQLVKEERGLDKGIVRYALVLALVAGGLFLLLTLLGVKAIDTSVTVGSLLAHP
ncbi:MAG: hypothetical protein ACJ78Q_12095 [Chloroflexia bacterium]